MIGGKKIITFISHTPFGSPFCEEGLRLALGINNTRFNHKITTILINDGVWLALNTISERDFEKYLKAFFAMDMEFIIEKESLEKRKISEDLIKSNYFIIKSKAEIFDYVKQADFSICY
jgi:sulfur relay (sulfurtransferase) DsrF/TusC family protein